MVCFAVGNELERIAHSRLGDVLSKNHVIIGALDAP